jgi:uncharacterized protein (UPF0261 family)
MLKVVSDWSSADASPDIRISDFHRFGSLFRIGCTSSSHEKSHCGGNAKVTAKGCIAVLATLDTKGEEVAYVKELLATRGHTTTVIDVGTLNLPRIPPDFSKEEVARTGGWELADLTRKGERALIMDAMGKGAEKLLLHLYRQRRIDGVLALGGNQGSAIASIAMRALPFGFPKYLVSTVASGNIRPYVGHKDIGVVFSVGDFLGGPNPVTRIVLANAVSAVVGMIEFKERMVTKEGDRTIAITALGNTEPAAALAVKLLRQKGFQVIPFHASGAGGTAMEELIEEDMIHGVLDLTPHELTEEVVGAGAYLPVKPGRLKAAGAKGIPQVVSTGGMEYLCFGPKESIPPRLRRRKIYMHNPYNANVGVSRTEMAEVGRTMAERLNQASGPTALLIPARGWSVYGSKGGPLHDEAGTRAFLKSLKTRLRDGILLEEVDAHINEPIFVNRCVSQLADFMNDARS